MRSRGALRILWPRVLTGADHAMPTRPLLVAVSLGLMVLSPACTLVLPPDGGDDDVERCKSASDCSGFEDGRLIPVCVSEDSDVNNAPGVCVAAWRPQSCNPSNMDTNLGMNVAAAVALGTDAYPSSCTPENAGKRGCGPGANGCDSGLESVDGICQVAGAPVQSGVSGETSLLGQDVMDQYCRFFFCSADFVCDRTGGQDVCRPCDPSKPFGQGGCEEMWINGSASPIYMDQATLGGSCKNASPLADDPDAFVGGLPAAPTP